MNPEAAEFHPSVLALVPTPLVLGPIPIPVARKQQRRRRKKKKGMLRGHDTFHHSGEHT